jgi:hypothetical protein
MSFTTLKMWKNTIKANLKEISWKGLARIGLVRGGDKWQALVKTVMNRWVAKNAEISCLAV